VLENGVLGPQKGQISPRGPTMVCAVRGVGGQARAKKRLEEVLLYRGQNGAPKGAAGQMQLQTPFLLKRRRGGNPQVSSVDNTIVLAVFLYSV
jgi:hypothetical protein